MMAAGEDFDDSIWRWGKGSGCEVHFNLSKLLYVPRISEPPPQKKGNNRAKGAGNDVLDHQDAVAQERLHLS